MAQAFVGTTKVGPGSLPWNPGQEATCCVSSRPTARSFLPKGRQLIQHGTWKFFTPRTCLPSPNSCPNNSCGSSCCHSVPSAAVYIKFGVRARSQSKPLMEEEPVAEFLRRTQGCEGPTWKRSSGQKTRIGKLLQRDSAKEETPHTVAQPACFSIHQRVGQDSALDGDPPESCQ
jgi:hypothetical protein